MERKDITELLGRFLKEQNLDLIAPYLHSNIIYATDGLVGEEIGEDRNVEYPDVLFGLGAFIAHFKNKFQAGVKPLNVTSYYVHPLERGCKHFLLLKKEQGEPKQMMMLVEELMPPLCFCQIIMIHRRNLIDLNRLL